MALFDLFGISQPSYMTDLLDEEKLRALKESAGRQALMQAGLSALSQSGYSKVPVGLGEILGKAGTTGLESYQGALQQGAQDALLSQKLAEAKQQLQQKAAYDLAAQDLFRTIPAEYETRQVSGGGYLPAQQQVMPGQVAPNFNLSQTMAPPTTEQVMTRPEIFGIDNAALLKMLQTGDPRATAMMSALTSYKDYIAPPKVDSPFAKIDPKDYTPESFNAYVKTGDVTQLRAVDKSKAENIQRYTGAYGNLALSMFGTQNIDEISPTQRDQLDAEARKRNLERPPSISITLPSESERTAGFLTERLQSGLAQLNAIVTKNPKAATPNIGAEAVQFLTGSDYLKNLANPEARQRIEAAQLEVLDSALTLGTGAAYTREQLENYRKSYFPQLGDRPQTVKDKQRRLEVLLDAAKRKSGRAMPPPGRSNNDIYNQYGAE